MKMVINYLFLSGFSFLFFPSNQTDLFSYVLVTFHFLVEKLIIIRIFFF